EGSLHAILGQLYADHAAVDPDNHYLQNHGRPRSIANHIRTFEWYLPFLPTAGNILDWGCNHGPDSCLLRATAGDRFCLFGCDFSSSHKYQTFHDYSKLVYAQIESPVDLPYAANSFDAVIGSGVLEHVAQDYESLKEIYRILKPGGVLVI